MDNKSDDHTLKYDKNIEYLYSEARVVLNRFNKKNKLYIHNIVNFAVLLIPCVQNLISGNNKGQYKKQLLLKVITLVLEKEVKWDNEKDKNLALSIVETVLPNAIDISIGIGKGLINLGKNKKCCICF